MKEMNKDIKNLITKSIDEIIVRDSLIDKLNSGKKLVVKLGIDPTGSKLHLGHVVVLKKLKEFQELGHQIILIIGDFTARIGDPSGKNKERKTLSSKEIENNMKTYKQQIEKILDLNKTKFVYNSQWLAKMDLKNIFELASKTTFAQIFERNDFRQRIEEGNDISYLETLYPLMQGYDSVQLKADVELGGTDQKFNLLMGRQIQKRYKQKEQDVVIVKLLPGLDGAKMSKSANNFISIDEKPFDMYSKVMSISDNLIPEYYELCTNISSKDLEKIVSKLENEKEKVYEIKRQLAKEIVEIYHGANKAKLASDNFVKVYKYGQYKEAEIHIVIKSGNYKLREIPILSNATTSTVQAKKLVMQGAVEINNKKILDPNQKISLKAKDIIRIGKKRFVKVK